MFWSKSDIEDSDLSSVQNNQGLIADLESELTDCDYFNESVMNILYMVASLPDQLEENATQSLYNEFRTKLLSLERFQSDQVILSSCRYCLCCLIDEKIMKKPWGKISPWPSQSLLSLFFNETHGGEKFFQIIQMCIQQPQRYYVALEIAGYCLSFGFKGKYYHLQNGEDELLSIRNEVFQWLIKDKNVTKKFQSEYPIKNYPIVNKKRLIPLTLIFAITVLCCLLSYGSWYFYSSDLESRMFSRIYTWSPSTSLEVERVPLQDGQTFNTDDLIESPVNNKSSLGYLLEKEIKENLVSYKQKGNVEFIILTGNLFESGSTKISKSQEEIISLLADKINLLGTPIEVIGHTDNIPIKSFSFPSNWHLSRARAEAFSLKLINLGVSDELISVLGMGDSSPLKPNNSAENRALNRRIEVKHILSY